MSIRRTHREPPCCTPSEAWAWVQVITADALAGDASLVLVSRAIAHWYAMSNVGR